MVHLLTFEDVVLLLWFLDKHNVSCCVVRMEFLLCHWLFVSSSIVLELNTIVFSCYPPDSQGSEHERNSQRVCSISRWMTRFEPRSSLGWSSRYHDELPRYRFDSGNPSIIFNCDTWVVTVSLTRFLTSHTKLWRKGSHTVDPNPCPLLSIFSLK